MNRTEATQVVTYLNRAGLVGALEGQAAVWADVLEDVPYVTAQEVVRGMAKSRTSGQRWVTPGDVRDAVKVIRDARLASIKTPEPPETIDPDDTAAQLAWTRTYLAAVADGRTEAEADVVACGRLGVTRPQLDGPGLPVAAVIESAAQSARLPRDVVAAARRDSAAETRRRPAWSAV